MKPIYLDYNASTPIAPEVAEAMRPFLSQHKAIVHRNRRMKWFIGESSPTFCILELRNNEVMKNDEPATNWRHSLST